jgi:serine/threonine protein kinase
MLRDAAAGMTFLAGRGIVHRDLALRNLLVGTQDGRYVVKVADFGLSKQTSADSYYMSTQKKLPVRWTSPEALDFGKFSEKSDVWSYGVVTWEVYAGGAIPYAAMTNQEVHTEVKQGFRLSFEHTRASETLGDFIVEKCWATGPNDRPTFTEVLSVVGDLTKEALGDSSDDSEDRNDNDTARGGDETYTMTPGAAYQEDTYMKTPSGREDHYVADIPADTSSSGTPNGAYVEQLPTGEEDDEDDEIDS